MDLIVAIPIRIKDDLILTTQYAMAGMTVGGIVGTALGTMVGGRDVGGFTAGTPQETIAIAATTNNEVINHTRFLSIFYSSFLNAQV